MWTSIPKLISTSFPKGVPNSHGAGCSAIGFTIDQADRALYSQVKQTLALRECKGKTINEIMVRGGSGAGGCGGTVLLSDMCAHAMKRRASFLDDTSAKDQLNESTSETIRVRRSMQRLS